MNVTVKPLITCSKRLNRESSNSPRVPFFPMEECWVWIKYVKTDQGGWHCVMVEGVLNKGSLHFMDSGARRRARSREVMSNDSEWKKVS